MRSSWITGGEPRISWQVSVQEEVPGAGKDMNTRRKMHRKLRGYGGKD